MNSGICIRKAAGSVGTALLLSLLTLSCARREYAVCDGAMIGTTFHISADLPASRTAEIRSALKALEEEASASMSIFDDNSLLNRINRNETDSLDGHILRNLLIARNIGENIDSRYDITVKPLTEALGFTSKPAAENPNIDSLLTFIGYDKWRIGDGRVIKEDPRVQFDLNSVAKGYTVDMVGRMLESKGAKNYLVEIGGEIRCRGLNPAGNPWNIGIDTPYEGNMLPGTSLSGTISLTDKSVATSGNYRRFHIDAQGNKIAHTIDPKTGKTVISRLLSATVIADECAVADALATMFLAAGADDALSLAAKMRDSIKVFFILDNGGEYEIFNTIDDLTADEDTASI